MRILVCLLLLSLNLFAQEHISIIVPESSYKNSIVNLAIEDLQEFLPQACDCRVDINNPENEFYIVIPAIESDKYKEKSVYEMKADYPVLHYPKHWYHWTSKRENGKTYVSLETETYAGVGNAIYGLMQEQMGFKFYHPKETYIPKWGAWPVSARLDWMAYPRFDKKGFHLHTMHPIELTEALLNEQYPQALDLVKEYIDWLARNGQNYFEFNLLEGINLRKWPAFAKEIVGYCHMRGIIAGLDVSLHMIQQKAFQLYRNWPASWRSKEIQIAKRLEKLFESDWDVLAVEFSTHEFSSGNVEEKAKLQLFLTDLLVNKYKAKLAGRKHVVKESEEQGSGKKRAQAYQMTDEEFSLDQNRGLFVHTVMFYSISEALAPVYQNDNLRHMLDILIREKDQRETWYYPESAYWVTFDSSIPLFLLPYLSARLDDIQLMDSLQVPGHLTFSSGWEWGYWLFDWSIARWSWKYHYQDEPWRNKEEYPSMYIADLFGRERITKFFEENLKLQNEYLKDKELMRYMTAMTVTDEIPEKYALEFHPRPEVSYKKLAKESDSLTIKEKQEKWLPLLQEFYSKTLESVEELEGYLAEEEKSIARKRGPFLNSQKVRLLQELVDGVTITGLRAKHRYHTLDYLLSKRWAKLQKEKDPSIKAKLQLAEETRELALDIVRNREANYRYDLEYLTTKRKGNTAYHFGYLYPVHNLHFWKREEKQFKGNHFSPFYKSIWNVWRIIGVIN